MEKLKSILNRSLDHATAPAVKTAATTKSNHTTLFYGTAKDDIASAVEHISKELNKKVFHVDLSKTISKYIGETEKNLSAVFDKATNKNWILFFDEADALFGKRTNIKDAHDKYANQVVNYLLKEMEKHQGLVIISAKSKSNIDAAFLRRFHTKIHFPTPRLTKKKLNE